MPATELKLYTFPLSGHAHRVELALSLLGLAFERYELDLLGGEQHSDWFKKLNPAGKVPVLVDGDIVVHESTAILTYLGAKYDNGTWMPTEPEAAAAVQQWFVQANTAVATGPAVARVATLFDAPLDLEAAQKTAHDFMAFLEASLAGKVFLLGEQATFADVAIYSYTAHAPEGHVSLSGYPAVQRWIKAVEALEGFTPMPKSDVGVAA